MTFFDGTRLLDVYRLIINPRQFQAVSGQFIFLSVLLIGNHLFEMELDNVTIVPPRTLEHRYPIASIGPVALRQEVLEKLIDFCRNNEMADIYWLATEKRPDIRENI